MSFIRFVFIVAGLILVFTYRPFLCMALGGAAVFLIMKAKKKKETDKASEAGKRIRKSRPNNQSHQPQNQQPWALTATFCCGRLSLWRKIMTDEQVERFIWKEIKKRKILFQDMIGIPTCGVDPNPEDFITARSEKGIRSNRFQSMMGSERMKELLCIGKYNEWVDYPPLKISFQDLFRFWWSRCVDQDVIVDDILSDIYDHFLELMRPPQKEEPQMDITVDFQQMPLFMDKTEAAA